jgi:hypothetical protein
MSDTEIDDDLTLIFSFFNCSNRFAWLLSLDNFNLDVIVSLGAWSAADNWEKPSWSVSTVLIDAILSVPFSSAWTWSRDKNFADCIYIIQ